MTSCSKCKSKRPCTANAACWCHNYPKLELTPKSMACYCPDCLINALADKINAESVIVADSVRRDIARLGLPSEPKERIDYYFDKAGLIVMTKWYHLRRGTCCDNGCLHCPY